MRAVDDHAQVELPGDRGGLLHQDPLDLLPFRTGLVGDELHPDDPFGRPLRLVGVVGQLDAAALPAPPGVYLRLDDDAPAQPFGDAAGLRRRLRHAGLGDRNAEGLQNLFPLKLMDLHGRTLKKI